MKAAVYAGPCNIETREVAIPQPAAGQVRIQVALAGICGSDHKLYHDKCGVTPPRIPGHEAVGRIDALGPGVENLSPGQRVTIQPNFGCQDCALCRRGRDNVCRAKVRLGLDCDGVFAEYVAVPARYVWPLPEGLTDEVAVFTEPLAVAAHGRRLARPARAERVLILGAGVIGQLCLQLAILDGAAVTAIDLSAPRLELARRMGAVALYNPSRDPDLEPDRFDVVFETSGAPAALAQAVELAAPGGRIVVMGITAAVHPVSSERIVRKELQIFGSMIYTNEFPECIALLAAGRIQTGPLATSCIRLADLAGALEAFAAPDRIKVLVRVPA